MKILCLYNNDCAIELFEHIKALGHETVLFSDRLSVEYIENGHFDLAVSYTYRFIVKEEILKALNYNAVNIHNAYLPYNRGADPNIWSLVEGTPRGVTLHYMNRELDKGFIIAQRKVVEGDGDTLRSSYDNLDKNAKELFLEAFKYYSKWPEIKRPASGKGTYHSLKDGEAIKSFISSYDMKISEFLNIIKAAGLVNR